MFEKNLKYYRLKKNMSVKELSEACGVSAMTISNYENGKRKPDMDMIKKLAKALDVYVVDFLASRNANLTFDHREFRKHSKLTKSQQEMVQESVEEYFTRFFDAVECIGGNPLPKPPACSAIKQSGDIEKDAKNLRKHLGLPEEGPIDELVGTLENKGIMVLEIDIDNDKFSGINGFVNEYPYIAINKTMRSERKRTTIMHELAHLMFVWDESKEKENEKTATAIAGAALVPGPDLQRELGIHRSAITKDMALVCDEFGVSLLLLVKRAAQTKIISPTLEKNFYIKANKVGYKNIEPERADDEPPKLLKQLVYRAVNEEGISKQRGAELLRIKVSEIDQYCGPMEV